MPAGLTPAAAEELVARLHRTGAHVVVDTSGPALSTLARSGALVLKPSRNELTQHAGRPLATIDDVVAAADGLRRLGRNDAVLVSLGAEGAVLVTDLKPPCLITGRTGPVVSTVGAGDSLVGGLVLGLASGERMVDAARRGVAAGSAATLAAGHHLCDPADVAALLPGVRVTPMGSRLAAPT
jgi:6-phosphofructokinase 2